MQIFTPAQVASEGEKRRSVDAEKAKVIADVTRDLLTEQANAEKLSAEAV